MERPIALELGCTDHLAVNGNGDGCASAVTVRWDRRAQCFHVHTLPLRVVGKQPTDGDEHERGIKGDHDEADLPKLLVFFDDAICRLDVPADVEAADASDNAPRLILSALKRLATQRDDVLERVFASKAPLSWLEQFLPKWQTRLVSLVTLADAASIHFSLWLGQELLVVAAGFQIIGNISEARSTSALALQMARTLQKRSTPANLTSRAAELQQSAKRALIAYVAFDTALTKNCELLGRHEPPKKIQAQLTSKFGALRLRAPLSVPILTAVTSLMEMQQRHAVIARVLSASTLTSLNANLTLLHARALERDGFWSHSIAVARRYFDKPGLESLQQGARERLKAHVTRLASLQQLRDQAERHARVDENDRAIASFSKCLELMRTGPSNDKVKSSLLLGRANALLAIGKASQALRDLEASVKLNPSNSVAQLVLKTTLLEQETSRIKAQLRS